MGSMWRALQTRQTITEPIKSLRAIHSTQVIEPERKLMRMGDFNLLHPEQKRNDKGYSIGSNPVLWLMSLEVFLRTLCKAGSYLVNELLDMLYRPLALRTNAQKRIQILLLEQLIREMKISFNKKFDDCFGTKEEKLDEIRNKNIRIQEILNELKVQEEYFKPQWNSSEFPVNLFFKW